jgi:hypothetical protein
MEYLRQVEEDLTALATEAKKYVIPAHPTSMDHYLPFLCRKYPEVKESTERALSTLKTIRGL